MIMAINNPSGNNGNLVVDWDSLSYAQRYQSTLTRDIARIQKLKSKGYKIKWSANGKWCEIAGMTFNVNKAVYDKRTSPNYQPADKEYHLSRNLGCSKICQAGYGHGIEILEDFTFSNELDNYYVEPEDVTKPDIPMWVITTLRRHGNCAFSNKVPFDIDDLAYYGLQVIERNTTSGIILERVN